MRWRRSWMSSCFYAVSDEGDVMRIKKAPGATTGRVLKPEINQKGYLQVVLCLNGKTKMTAVHRIVADAFIGPCPPNYDVHHKDGNKRNNRADNLEYLSKGEHLKKHY